MHDAGALRQRRWLSWLAGRDTRRADYGTSRRDWDRLSLLATLVIGPLVAVGQATGLTHQPIDFNFYWRATNFFDLYPTSWLDPNYAYVYPPPLAQLLAPVHVLPHDLAMAGWTVLCFVSLWYCAREWTLPVIAVGLIALYLPNGHVLGSGLGAVLLGNVQMPMAAAIVAGMRHPAFWAVPILTKLTTGVGILWYAFRHEWRSFAIAVAATAAVAAISFLIAPSTWSEYVDWTIANYGQPSSPPIVGPPLPLRVAASIVLVWLGARSDRRWVVAVAGGIAIPGLYGWTSIVSVSLGALALRRGGRAFPLGPPEQIPRGA